MAKLDGSILSSVSAILFIKNWSIIYVVGSVVKMRIVFVQALLTIGRLFALLGERQS